MSTKMKKYGVPVAIFLVVFLSLSAVVHVNTMKASVDLTYLWEGTGVDPDWVYNVTVMGDVALLAEDGTEVIAVSYRDTVNPLFADVWDTPEDLLHLGAEVYKMRIETAYLLPSDNLGRIEWHSFYVKAALYYDNHDNLLQSFERTTAYGTFYFDDLLLEDYFDGTTEGFQTEHFRVIVYFDCLTTENKEFIHRFVEDIPVTVKVTLPANEDGTGDGAEPDATLEPGPTSLDDVQIYPVETNKKMDKLLHVGIDPMPKDTASSLSLLPGYSGTGLTRIQEGLILSLSVALIASVLWFRGLDTIKQDMKAIERAAKKVFSEIKRCI